MISNVPFDQTAILTLSEANKSDLINYSIKNIVTSMARAWHLCREDNVNSWLINENTFDALWNYSTDLRQELIFILINCRISNKYGVTPLMSTEFSNQKLFQIENMIMNFEDSNSDIIRRIIVPVIYPNFDYKSEIIRLSEIGRSQEIINHWIDLASNHSADEELFEFLLSSVKRAEGATEIRNNILTKAFNNRVVCNNYIKKVAASAPISIKRTVVQGLSFLIRELQSQVTYPYSTSQDTDQLKKKLDNAENLAIMFASLNDRHILKDLGASLSVKNLPWVLPAAANIPWIAKDIQRRIDREGV